MARQCDAGMAKRGGARLCQAGRGKAGKVMRGNVRPGKARQITARHGQARQVWQTPWRGNRLSRAFGRLNILKPETKIALEMVAAGATVYRAAKTTGVAQSTVARAMAKKLCPHCGRPLKNVPPGRKDGK